MKRYTFTQGLATFQIDAETEENARERLPNEMEYGHFKLVNVQNRMNEAKK